MKIVSTLLCGLSLALLVGCTNMTPEEQGVLSGSALGAVGGAALGSLSGHAGEGAMIGAGIGALGGAMQSTNNQPRAVRKGPAPAREYFEEEVCYDDYCEIREYYYE
ncbi:MAG: hypothetical protein JSR17_09025 [Proteobacteria bacterium]|nr:hypothetical protein [Pseudomonadota bacterium]